MSVKLTIFITGLVLSAVVGFFVKYSMVNEASRRRYCGKVVRVDLVGNSGHPIVVFHADSLNRNVIVGVSPATYANAEAGQPICFRLTALDLEMKTVY